MTDKSRPGRFDHKIYIGVPTKDERREIMLLAIRGLLIDFDLNVVADLTEGFTGAQLQAIIRDAYSKARRRDSNEALEYDILHMDVVEAIEAIKYESLKIFERRAEKENQVLGMYQKITMK